MFLTLVQYNPLCYCNVIMLREASLSYFLILISFFLRLFHSFSLFLLFSLLSIKNAELHI